MTNSIENSLNDTIRSAHSKFASLKDGWKDNVQESFYNDKVNNLNHFFTRTTNEFNEINRNFNNFKSQLHAI